VRRAYAIKRRYADQGIVADAMNLECIVRFTGMVTELLKPLLERPKRLLFEWDFAIQPVKFGVVIPPKVRVDVIALQRSETHVRALSRHETLHRRNVSHHIGSASIFEEKLSDSAPMCWPQAHTW
jgi:hypothetical protein